ncbi:hypothetical protein TNCV_1744861 [Trichonephila clavipes]|nr:hypothetical protein TNCV_1744861 [Trichonephila clavipes]
MENLLKWDEQCTRPYIKDIPGASSPNNKYLCVKRYDQYEGESIFHRPLALKSHDRSRRVQFVILHDACQAVEIGCRMTLFMVDSGTASGRRVVAALFAYPLPMGLVTS